MAEAFDELAVLVELRDARIAEAGCVAFGDEDVAVSGKGDIRRLIEYIVAGSALAGFAERLQKCLAIAGELEDLVSFAVAGHAVDRPDIPIRIRLDRMRKNIGFAKILQHFALG